MTVREQIIAENQFYSQTDRNLISPLELVEQMLLLEIASVCWIYSRIPRETRPETCPLALFVPDGNLTTNYAMAAMVI